MARRRGLPVRGQLVMGGVFIALGAVSVLLSGTGILSRGEWVTGVLYLAVGALWLGMALQSRRRKQRGYGQPPPAAAPDVLTLVRQGEKIRAIKLYRQLHPGMGLREAKDAVDRL